MFVELTQSEMGDRLALTEFWEKQAHAPTVETMMLNVLAKKVDQQDKRDVLEALPNFEGMRIIELGAGIGRFTPILASKAEHVTAVDIVESFIETNRKNHEHMGNISFKTSEASAMKIASNSVDLVFTNWLLMYLTDAEVIKLMKSALKWLSVGGYLHIRESCSEPSKRSSTASNPNGISNSETNPTHYRHICQYLNVLDAVGIYDDLQDVHYKFEMLWTKSINTYVETYGNWRQVQVLVRKIIQPIHTSTGENGDKQIVPEAAEDACHLLKIIKNDSISGQAASNELNEMKDQLFRQRGPATEVLLPVLKELKKKVRWILNVSSDNNFDVCPFELAKGLDARVSDLESCAYAYNWKLSKSVVKQDKRIRLHWTDLHSAAKKNYDWSFLGQEFDLVIFSQPIATIGNLPKIIIQAKTLLAHDGRLIIFDEAESERHLENILSAADCDIVNITDVTKQFHKELKEKTEHPAEKSNQLLSYYHSKTHNSNRWFIVEAK